MEGLTLDTRLTGQQILSAASETSAKQTFDFVGLHNISKHVIHLQESCQATSSLVTRMCRAHQDAMTNVSCPERLDIIRSVQELLLHKCTLLEGLVLRVSGMEKRAQNLINLVIRLTTVTSHFRTLMLR